MVTSNPISDFFIRLKNAYAAKHDRVLIPFSNLKFNIANTMVQGGFLQEVGKKKKKINESNHLYIDVRLKYEDGEPAMHDIRMISLPSRRMYIKSSQIRSVRSGHGIAILSTPRGILTGKVAKKMNIGGEIIAEVW